MARWDPPHVVHRVKLFLYAKIFRPVAPLFFYGKVFFLAICFNTERGVAI